VGKVTPDTLFGLSVGDYEVSVALGGFTPNPSARTVTVQSEITVTASFELLAPERGQLAVISSPAGADILLDDNPTGRATPDTLELAPGDYVVRVQKEGYSAFPESWNATVQQDQLTVTSFALTLLTGSLRVISTPSGADILLDGELTGEQTPILLGDIPVGQHVVKVALEGYLSQPDSLLVTILADQTSEAAFTLNEIINSVQKVVLIESFSNVSCPGCGNAAQVLADLMALPQYGLDRVLTIKYSLGFPQISDPHYQANTSDNTERMNYYLDLLATGIPTFVGDGSLLGDSGNPPSLPDLVSLVDQLLMADPGFFVEVDATVGLSNVSATVTLNALRQVDLNDYALRLVLVENPIQYVDPPGSEGETEFHWVMRQFDTPYSSLPVLDPGIPIVLEANLPSDPSWQTDRLFVIAFVQNELTREVMQSGSSADSTPSDPSLRPGFKSTLPSPAPHGGTHP
jgi:hypothetical protein